MNISSWLSVRFETQTAATTNEELETVPLSASHKACQKLVTVWQFCKRARQAIVAWKERLRMPCGGGGMHGITALFDVFRVSANPTHCDTSGVSKIGVSRVTTSNSSSCHLMGLSFDNAQVRLSQVLSRHLFPFYRRSTHNSFSLTHLLALLQFGPSTQFCLHYP